MIIFLDSSILADSYSYYVVKLVIRLKVICSSIEILMFLPLSLLLFLCLAISNSTFLAILEDFSLSTIDVSVNAFVAGQTKAVYNVRALSETSIPSDCM